MSQRTPAVTRLLIADGDRDTLTALEQLLLLETSVQIVGTATSLHDALFVAEQKMPDVALIAAGAIGADALQVAQAIAERVPATRVVMVLSKAQATAEFLQRAMAAGAREFVIRPFDGEELLETLRRVAQSSQPPAPPATAPPTLSVPERARPFAPQPAPPAAPLAPPAPSAPARRGKVFAIYSTNGGIGRTTLAVNLAVALAIGGAERVALMDASLRFGDVGVLLNLRSRRNITDICSAGGKVDVSLLPEVLATHHSGIKVLLAPTSPELADVLTPHVLEQVLNALRGQFDYVIVDTFTSLDETILTILDQSDRILLLATSEIHVVKNTRLFFEVADLLKYPEDKIALVLNQHNPKGRIGVKDIEANISHPVFAVIDRDDVNAVEAVQAGQPFVISNPKTPISQAVFRMARALAPDVQPAAPRRRGLFRGG